MNLENLICDICLEDCDERYEIPCQYKYVHNGRIRKNHKEKRYICVNCWMAIQGAIQKERGHEATFEKIYKMGIHEYNEWWERTHKFIETESGMLRLVVLNDDDIIDTNQ